MSKYIDSVPSLSFGVPILNFCNQWHRLHFSFLFSPFICTNLTNILPRGNWLKFTHVLALKRTERHSNAHQKTCTTTLWSVTIWKIADEISFVRRMFTWKLKRIELNTQKFHFKPCVCARRKVTEIIFESNEKCKVLGYFSFRWFNTELIWKSKDVCR